VFFFLDKLLPLMYLLTDPKASSYHFQARMQVKYLKSVTYCKDIIAWKRNRDSLAAYQDTMENSGYAVQCTQNVAEIADNCNLIVTATPARKPLIQADQVRKGTHIAAMGSDTPEKQELDPKIFQKADIVVADSIEQCVRFIRR